MKSKSSHLFSINHEELILRYSLLKYLIYSGILLFMISNVGCVKDPDIPRPIPNSVDSLVYNCPSAESYNFFEGQIGDNQFCYYNGVEDYQSGIWYTSIVRTQGATLNLDSINSVDNAVVLGIIGFRPAKIGHLIHYLNIETPAVLPPPKDSVKNVIEQYFTPENIGIELPLQSDIVGSEDGFNFDFSYNENTEFSTTTLRSVTFGNKGGNQDGSYLKMTDLIIYDFNNGTKEYTVEFDFLVKLYYSGYAERYYDILEGVMKITFVI